ncbi:MAG: helix-turn-helix domain-containing protein [Candidatus Thiodiazotropha endolucinida]|nr:helix-turn-helix domain-containing protein [Candidatus Thiodiazotropha endolucinida]
MEPRIDLYAVMLLLGAAHGLFLTLVLLNAKDRDVKGHRFLALLTLVFTLDLGLAFLDHSRHLIHVPWLLALDLNIDYLFGPLTYLYVRALSDRNGYRFSRKQWLHFLPFTLGFLLLAPLYGLDREQLIALLYLDGETLEPEQLWAEVSSFVVGITSILQMAIYLFIAIRRLVRHKRNIQEEFSFLERIGLTWLRNLLIALALLYLLYIVDIILIGILELYDDMPGIHYPMIVVLIYVMGYMGLRQPEIFSHHQPPASQPAASESTVSKTPPEPAPKQEHEKRKYEKSALDSETSSLLFADLRTHMAAEKPYLDNKLNLSLLATQLDISPNYLSQVINEQAGQHFFDFVNRYRVEEAKQALAGATERGNILAIALDAGFNSKSAFYTAFKRHTGQTPSQYRRAGEIPGT